MYFGNKQQPNVLPGNCVPSFPALLSFFLDPTILRLQLPIQSKHISFQQGFLKELRPRQTWLSSFLFLPTRQRFFFSNPLREDFTGTVTLWLYTLINNDFFYPGALCGDFWADSLTTPSMQAVPLLRLLISNSPLLSPMTQLTASYFWTPLPREDTLVLICESNASLQFPPTAENTHIYSCVYVCIIHIHTYLQ